MAFKELKQQGAFLREIQTSSTGHAEHLGRGEHGLSSSGFFTVSLPRDSFLVFPKNTEFSLLTPKEKPVPGHLKALDFIVWLGVTIVVFIASNDVAAVSFFRGTESDDQ